MSSDGELWCFFRDLISQGTYIQMDYAAGKYKCYEEFSARLDEAARERVAHFTANRALQKQSAPRTPEETIEPRYCDCTSFCARVSKNIDPRLCKAARAGLETSSALPHLDTCALKNGGSRCTCGLETSADVCMAKVRQHFDERRRVDPMECKDCDGLVRNGKLEHDDNCPAANRGEVR